MKFRAVTLFVLFLFTLNAPAGVLARFKMNSDLGTIDVELFDQDKPITVNNFIAYVKSGLWHDTQIQRWQAGFVIQGGRYFMQHRDDLKTPLVQTNRTLITPFGTIPFELNVGRFFSNLFGTIAMARGADTNSAGAEWFFNLADNTNLDSSGGGYVVFGRTVRGTNILNFFNPPYPSGKLYQISDPDLPPSLGYLPAYSADGVNGFFVNLDITLLTVEIAQTRAGNEISWNSVEGRPNIVEFTNVLPPVWQTVQSVTGTGAKMSVTDNPGSDKMRQYRVRIDYSN
jgi:peptidyl-prolyl cis-trans isomerase A (cyclophilin A)